ncbi:hypothetical protein BKA70DRAFT_1554223 [Coprinopsis sp. MPI-PUGE-AT-0042]|nr:hypothetical protein BKA70DRAFT_1554223 [Coprinopsis sp. MPI-PUGE-AT-0042]
MCNYEPSTSSSSTCLRSMDIWHHIAAFINPLDLLTLLTTCSALRSLCRHRSVWLQAARTTCFSHGLFLPSFPLETMSVEELTRLALSPFNFSRLVSTGGDERLPEIQTRTFSPRMSRSAELSEPRSLHLLPGGRYLFTYHVDALCLWDLGYGKALPKPFPIASLRVGTICRWYGEKPPCPTEDGQGVLAIVLSQNASEAVWTLGMYEIRPVSKEPAFRCTTSWQVPGDSVILAYSSQYVVLRSSDMVQVYAVSDAKDEGPRCSLQDLWIEDGFLKVAILGDSVLLWEEEPRAAVQVLSIPRASSSVTAQSVVTAPDLIIPTSIPGDFMGMVYTSEWAGPSTSDGLFALGSYVSGDMTELHLYQMVDLAPLSKPLLPSAIPAKVGKVFIPNWYSFIGGPNLHPMTSAFVVIGLAGGQVELATFPMPQTPHEEAPSPHVKALTNDSLYEDNDLVEEVTACVATGRLVTANVSTLNGDRDCVIRVIDYLSLA